MLKSKLKRLATLLAKAADDRSSEEMTEMKSLQKEAIDAGFNPMEPNVEDGDEDEPDDDGSKAATIDDVKSVVLAAIKESAEDGDGKKSLDADDVVAKVLKGIEGKIKTGKDGNTEKAITDAVAKALENFKPSGDGSKDFKAELEKATGDIVTKLKEEIRLGSKMVHPDGKDNDMDMVIATREGNLSIAQQQLKNIILSGFGKAKEGEKLPTEMDEGITESQLRKAARNGEKQLDMLRMRSKAQPFATGTSGGGSELTETLLSSDIMFRMYMASDLARIMAGREVRMPRNPFAFPVRLNRTKFRKKTQNTSSAGTDAGSTGDVTLTASTAIGIADWSYEVDTDSVVAVLPLFQDELGSAAGATLESILINGDNSGTHMDADTEADADAVEKNFKGFRKLALAASLTRAVTSVSAANAGSLKKDLKRYGHRPSQCVYICSESSYQDWVELDEVKTVEKYGTDATIRTGTLNQLWGIPLIPSEALREDMNDSGIYDGSTTDKSGVLLVNYEHFLMGRIGDMLIETDVDKKAQTYSVIASFRRDMQPKEALSADVPAVAYGYNLGL